MSDYEKCGCGFWTLEPQEAWHDEPRKYGVVRHRRNAPCWATPNDPPDSEMVEWTWRRRAEAAEAEVERLTLDLGALERSRREAEEWIRTLDHRVARALAVLHHPTEVNGCTCLAHQIADILRGESDE